MQTFVYALMICLYAIDPKFEVASGCRHPDNGVRIYRTAEHCQHVANLSNQDWQANNGKFRIERRCFRRAVNVWEPLD